MDSSEEISEGILTFDSFYGIYNEIQLKKLAVLDKAEVLEKILPGDQVWMWRKQVYKRFAHVGIYLKENDIVHCTKSMFPKSTITKDNISKVIGKSKCFIVRLDDTEQCTFKGLPEERALACCEEHVKFNYTGSRDNCEAFSNYMYGIWKSDRATLQGKDIHQKGLFLRFLNAILLKLRGSSLRSVVYSVLTKRGFEDMERRRTSLWSI